MSGIPTILFPSAPGKSDQIDEEFRSEWEAAQEVGFEVRLYGLGALRHGDMAAALSEVGTADEPTLLIHRGWMLREEDYGHLFASLTERGYRPVTNPEQYAETHYLPNAYGRLVGETPETVWMFDNDLEEAWRLYQTVAENAVIIKDHVKSAKYRWRDACFLPARTERERFEEILRNFLTARGRLFERGIVFRRFHPLRQLSEDIRGMPIHDESRLFFWKGQCFAAPADDGWKEQKARWNVIARRFHSPFFSMDVVRQEDDTWLVLEMGDGGVAGLPLSIPVEGFYANLWSVIKT